MRQSARHTHLFSSLPILRTISTVFWIFLLDHAKDDDVSFANANINIVHSQQWLLLVLMLLLLLFLVVLAFSIALEVLLPLRHQHTPSRWKTIIIRLSIIKAGCPLNFFSAEILYFFSYCLWVDWDRSVFCFHTYTVCGCWPLNLCFLSSVELVSVEWTTQGSGQEFNSAQGLKVRNKMKLIEIDCPDKVEKSFVIQGAKQIKKEAFRNGICLIC